MLHDAETELHQKLLIIDIKSGISPKIEMVQGK